MFHLKSTSKISFLIHAHIGLRTHHAPTVSLSSSFESDFSKPQSDGHRRVASQCYILCIVSPLIFGFSFPHCNLYKEQCDRCTCLYLWTITTLRNRSCTCSVRAQTYMRESSFIERFFSSITTFAFISFSQLLSSLTINRSETLKSWIAVLLFLFQSWCVLWFD